MSVSAALVACRRDRLEAVEAKIGAMSGVEVHYRDPAGRLVVTIEGSNTDGCEEQLRAIQELADVLSAEMAVHVFEDEGHP